MQRLGKEVREKMNNEIYRIVEETNKSAYLLSEALEMEAAIEIWKEMRKEILELSREGRFCYKQIATLSIPKKGVITVVYHEGIGNMYKSFVVSENLKQYRVVLALAWVMSEYNLEVVPRNTFTNQNLHDWSIEFTRR